MKVLGLVFCVFVLCSTVVMLVGCSTGGAVTGPAQNGAPSRSIRGPLGVASLAATRATAASREQTNRGASWMAPEARNDDLLYISNAYTVTVYSYPKGRLVGTLKGFYVPEGECVDNMGNVFITNEDTVVEYKHGGKKPIQTLTFSGYGAESCGVDPTTGDLAVTWDAGFSKGYVAVYQHASGSPTLYSNGDMLFAFCGYDDAGNLYVDGQYGEAEDFAFAELPKNGTSLESITLNQSIEFQGPVQWDGKYIAVGDNEAYKIYRFTISGSKGTLEGTSSLEGEKSLEQWWIDGKKVVGSDDLASTVWYWNYPAGGSPTKAITKGVGAPAGATISKTEK